MKRKFAAGFVALALTIGCAGSSSSPKIGNAPAAANADPQKAWADVLSRYVDPNGRIDFASLSKNRANLDAYVAWIGQVAPSNTPAPNRDAKLAYYINAYNALAMYNVLASGKPKDLSAVKVEFFHRHELVLGGEKMSLDDLESRFIHPMEDPRVHFALNGMARGSPRLPREPFRADQIDMELEAVAQYFLNEDRNVQVVAGKGKEKEKDKDQETVRFSEILQLYADDFRKKAPSLTAYANKYRESKIPETDGVGFIPYDWTLNQK